MGLGTELKAGARLEQAGCGPERGTSAQGVGWREVLGGVANPNATQARQVMQTSESGWL